MINDWCFNSHMVININKLHFLLHNIHDDVGGLFSLSCGGRGLSHKHETKLLGFIRNDRLTWHDHVSYISKKVAKAVTLLQLCRPFLDNKTSIIYNHFIFAHQKWYPYCLQSITKLYTKGLHFTPEDSLQVDMQYTKDP